MLSHPVNWFKNDIPPLWLVFGLICAGIASFAVAAFLLGWVLGCIVYKLCIVLAWPLRMVYKFGRAALIAMRFQIVEK